MIYDSLEDRYNDVVDDPCIKSDSDGNQSDHRHRGRLKKASSSSDHQAILQVSQVAAGQFQPPHGPAGATGVVDKHYSGDQHQHGGWTDSYSESEAEDGYTGLRKEYGYPVLGLGPSGYHYNSTSISAASSLSNVSHIPDKQVSRLTHQSQMSLLYQSNQQLADVPEEFQEELTASIVGQHRDRFTLYKVVIKFGNRVWFVLRRYSDFALLNKKLQKQFPVFHFELPPRRIDRSKFNHAFIDERQHALNGYLKTLLVHQEYVQCTHVKRFLKLDDPPKADPEDVQMCCQALQQQNDFLYYQLQSAKVEIIALKGGKIPPGAVELKHTPTSQNMGYEEQLKDYQDALARAKEEEQKARRELEDLRCEIKAESIGAREARHQILKRKDGTIEKQMENFDKLHVNLDEQLDAMCKEVSGDGQTEKATTAHKMTELKQIIRDWETVLRNNHQETVEAFAKEILELRFQLAKKSEVIKAREEEIRQQREEMHQNRLWFNHDRKQKRERIKTLDEQLKSLEKRCFYAEEQYFFALFVGAKLSISMSHHKKFSLNDIHPQELFEKVRNEGTTIKNWASWIAKEMKL